MRNKRKPRTLTHEDQIFMEELYHNHKNTIYFSALRECGNQDLANDLSQDCVIKLMDKIETIRKIDCCKIDAYIVITIRRLYINYLVKESKVTLLPIDQPSITARTGAIISEIEQDHEDAKLTLEMILEQLAPRDRLLLESKYILGLSDEEIASAFDCKPSSVREYLVRARKRAQKIGLKSGKGDVKKDG